jgi:nucleoid DNA-binding protein
MPKHTEATYNLKDLSDDVAVKFGVSFHAGSEITKFIFDRIKSNLAAGKQVRLHQFGTLAARQRKAGEARNPATGARVTVPARRVVKLNVSPALKRLVAV